MKRVLVVGDAIVDEYVLCKFKKECSDAPGANAYVTLNSQRRPGGAANVAINIAAMRRPTDRITVDLIAVIDDDLGKQIDHLSKFGVDLSHCVNDRPLVKTRYVDESGRTMIRVDDKGTFPNFVDEQILSRLLNYFANHDPTLVVWSDYAAKTIGRSSRDLLLACRDSLIIDTKETDLSLFARDGVKTLCAKLNRDEWAAAVANDPYPERFFQYMVVTEGVDGSRIVTADEMRGKIMTKEMRFPAFKSQVVDVCGCGDTFMAGFVVSLLRTGDPFDSVRFGNAAAATVVNQRWTSVADREQAEALAYETI